MHSWVANTSTEQSEARRTRQDYHRTAPREQHLPKHVFFSDYIPRLIRLGLLRRALAPLQRGRRVDTPCARIETTIGFNSSLPLISSLSRGIGCGISRCSRPGVTIPVSSPVSSTTTTTPTSASATTATTAPTPSSPSPTTRCFVQLNEGTPGSNLCTLDLEVLLHLLRRHGPGNGVAVDSLDSVLDSVDLFLSEGLVKPDEPKVVTARILDVRWPAVELFLQRIL